MAKTPVPVDKNNLIICINEIESTESLTNRSQLWQKAAFLYNNKFKPEREVTPSVVMLRVDEWNISVKTPPGRRLGSPMTEDQKAAMKAGRTGPRVSKADKFSKNNKIKSAFDTLEKKTPSRFINLVVLARGGSRNAAVKLKCLDCSCYDTRAVRECPAVSCGLWAFRPYQSKSKEAIEIAA